MAKKVGAHSPSNGPHRSACARESSAFLADTPHADEGEADGDEAGGVHVVRHHAHLLEEAMFGISVSAYHPGTLGSRPEGAGPIVWISSVRSTMTWCPVRNRMPSASLGHPQEPSYARKWFSR